jgi:hypothetical protein
MLSAFGIEHGEFSKARNPLAAFRAASAAKKTASMQARTDVGWPAVHHEFNQAFSGGKPATARKFSGGPQQQRIKPSPARPKPMSTGAAVMGKPAKYNVPSKVRNT